MDLKRYVEEFEYAINTVDFGEADLDLLYRNFEQQTQGLAKTLHVGRVTVDIFITPSVLEMDGAERHLETNYADAYNTHVEAALSYEFNLEERGRGVCRIYPLEGYFFDMDETDSISSVARVTYVLLSRAMAVRNLRRCAVTDMMTGLANTRGIIDWLNDPEKHPDLMEHYVSIFFSLKNFKLINRKYGVRIGDQVIRVVADRLYHFIEEDELAARPGGDNMFVCVKKERLGDFMNMISGQTIPVRTERGEEEVPVGLRVGIYRPTPEEKEHFTPESMIENASIANNITRKVDTGDVVEFHPEMINRVMRSKQVAAMFPEAFRNREFLVYYQPMVDTVTGKLSCCEALIRWAHDGQLISPGEFIPVAENEGVVEAMDFYVAEQACMDLRAWIDAGLDPVRVSVNLSTRDLEDPELAMKLCSLLDKYGIDASLFEVELTETAGYSSFSVVEGFINQMHDKGVLVSMDDFGTGYSSLSLFMKLDFDIVKLDRSFITKIESENEKDLTVLKSVIMMLQDLHMDVVAEGVETQNQLDYVRSARCNLVQGFYYDRPLPHDEFTERLLHKQYSDHEM